MDLDDADHALRKWMQFDGKTWTIGNPGALDALTEAGLWMEHCDFTPSWTHWQGVPPASMRRVYIPR